MLNNLSKLKRTVCVVLLISSIYTIFTPIDSISFIANSSLLSPESNTPPILINSDDDFVNYGFSGNGSISNPYIIDGYIIITTHKTCITINDTTKHFVIRDCILDGIYYGLFIDNITAGTAKIQENHFENNDYNAIYLKNAPSSVVSDNYFSNNYLDIYVRDSPWSKIQNNIIENLLFRGIDLRDSWNTIIDNNTCRNGGNGLKINACDSCNVTNNKFDDFYFRGIVIYNSNLQNIANNEFTNCAAYGIELIGTDSSNISRNLCNNNYFGIFLHSSLSNNILNNTCYNNQNGIYLTSVSDSNFLRYNLLQSNTEYGMHVGLSDDNNIYHNSFVENNLDGTAHGNSQAYDNGTNNLWYNISLTEGNFWSDWSGAGGYLIDGIGGSVDLYPFLSTIVPVITENYLISFILFFSTTLSFVSIASIYRRKKG